MTPYNPGLVRQQNLGHVQPRDCGGAENLLFPRPFEAGTDAVIPSTRYIVDVLSHIGPVGDYDSHRCRVPASIGRMTLDAYDPSGPMPFPLWLVLVTDLPTLINALFTPLLLTYSWESLAYFRLFQVPYVDMLISLHEAKWASVPRTGARSRATPLSYPGQEPDPVTREFLGQVRVGGTLLENMRQADALANFSGPTLMRLGPVFDNELRHVLFSHASQMHPKTFAQVVPLLGLKYVVGPPPETLL